MKKILFLFASICVSILTKAQDAPVSTCIFLINENGKSTQIFTNSKFPSRLAFGNGDIVEINPNSATTFIDQDGIELSFDARTPGVFMNKDGDLVVPCANEAKSPKIVDPNPKGSKSRTNKNTTANLKNKDRGQDFLGIVEVPTNKPLIKVAIINGKANSSGNNIVLTDARTTNSSIDPNLRSLAFIFEDGGNSTAGSTLTKAKLFGEKLIELSKDCRGNNPPNYCKTFSRSDILEIELGREAENQLFLKIIEIPGFENLPRDRFARGPAGLATIK